MAISSFIYLVSLLTIMYIHLQLIMDFELTNVHWPSIKPHHHNQVGPQPPMRLVILCGIGRHGEPTLAATVMEVHLLSDCGVPIAQCSSDLVSQKTRPYSTRVQHTICTLYRSFDKVHWYYQMGWSPRIFSYVSSHPASCHPARPILLPRSLSSL